MRPHIRLIEPTINELDHVPTVKSWKAFAAFSRMSKRIYEIPLSSSLICGGKKVVILVPSLSFELVSCPIKRDEFVTVNLNWSLNPLSNETSKGFSK